MKIKNVSIDLVKPYPGNPRKNAQAVDKVAESIKEFGFKQPLVVDSEMVVVIGHTRLLAARKLGLDKVPVHIAEDLTEPQIKALRIADNKTGELAEWDEDLLKIELKDLKALDFNMDATGFDSAEIQLIIKAVTKLPSEPPPAKPKNALPRERERDALKFEIGDLIVIGNHELMVGHEDKPILKKVIKFIKDEFPEVEITKDDQPL